MSTGLSINRKHVVAETIDDETILIHLGTGIYYSLHGVGSMVWALAEQGRQPAEIVDALRSVYPAEDGLEQAVSDLVTELRLEDLIVEGEDEQPAAPAPAPPAEAPAAYAAPSLQKYTDMQEFMLVDPLHDVDEEAGWPNVKAG